MQNHNKSHIALVHPELGLAGPEAVAVWMLQALKDRYAISLITCRDVNISRINDFFGTTLKSDDFSVVRIPLLRFMTNNSRCRLLKQHLLMRYCKRHHKEFGLFISSYNEMDFGKRGIQYIHFPSMHISYGEKYNLLTDNWYYKDTFTRRLYYMASMLFSGYSNNQVKHNTSLVNSSWTGDIFKRIYGSAPVVLHPPVRNNNTVVDWDSREDGFVCLSRIEPDKRVCDIISILSLVRNKGIDVHLHVIGKYGSDARYIDKFENLLADNSSWVTYEGTVSRDRLDHALANHKYGLHGKKYEHFGIGVAEMVNSGCITFVKNDGGQVDIIGKEDLLTYASDEEGALKIVNVLTNSALQHELRNKLKTISRNYSVESFSTTINNIVADHLKGAS
ncbi:glycosyltransferase [Candidatus Omnitrophota bacterium]